MDCWVSHNGSRRAKQCPMEWVLAVRKRSLVAFDRSQVGPDRTKRRSNRASRSTDGSQHHVPQAPVARAVFLVLLLLNQRGVRVAKMTMTHGEDETPEDVLCSPVSTTVLTGRSLRPGDRGQDPATERRRPSLCRVGTASARARTPASACGTGDVPKRAVWDG